MHSPPCLITNKQVRRQTALQYSSLVTREHTFPFPSSLLASWSIVARLSVAAVAQAPPRPAGGRESNRAGSRRFTMQAASRARRPRPGTWSRRLGALLLPPRRVG